MEPSSKTPKEAYIEGRLMGLNELISILKDSMEETQKLDSSVIVKSIVNHISGEMGEILDEVHGSHPAKAMALLIDKHEEVQKHAESLEDIKPAKAPEALKKNFQTTH